MVFFKKDFVRFVEEANCKYTELALEEVERLEGKPDYYWEKRVKAILDGVGRGKFAVPVSYPLSNKNKRKLSFYLMLLRFYGAKWNSWKINKDSKTAVAIVRKKVR